MRINMKATYIKTKLQSVITISRIVTIHYYEFDRNFVFHGESHNFWEMVYVDKGAVEIKRNDEYITLKQGEIVFHCPDEFHSIKALGSCDLGNIVVHQNVFQDALCLAVICDVVHDGKDVCVTCHVCIARFIAVDKRTFFVIPIEFIHATFQRLALVQELIL